MPRRPFRDPRSWRTTPTGRQPLSTVTWRRRCSMARKRVSMHEGPLAELFRATEAAQSRQTSESRPHAPRPVPVSSVDPATRVDPAQTEILPPEHAPTEILSVVPEPTEPDPGAFREAEPVQEEAEPEQPIARWLEPLPESPARL